MERLSDEQLGLKLRQVEENYKYIEESISQAAFKSGRQREDITFLAATKTVEPSVIDHAIGLGLKYIGENRVQELLSKYSEYDLNNAQLQFIGRLQSNKVRQVIDKVSLIQSVDSAKLALEISRRAKEHGLTMDVLVEVNIGDEENKSGVRYEMLDDLIGEIAEMECISVKGLMAIPPICETSREVCKYFEKMHKIFIDISTKKTDNVSMDILSMGMSDDYSEAIMCGANMVRVGSALFGRRNYAV